LIALIVIGVVLVAAVVWGIATREDEPGLKLDPEEYEVLAMWHRRVAEAYAAISQDDENPSIRQLARIYSDGRTYRARRLDEEAARAGRPRRRLTFSNN
jgi:DUF1680 family protein